MSQLSSDYHNRSENDIEAKNKIIFALEIQNDLSLSYTHHPAILYWAFSCEIGSVLQLKIVGFII